MTRAHDHADDRRRPSAAEQLTDTMFEHLAKTPVPSQPRRGSQETADRLQRSRARISKEHMVLARLALGAVTVDAYVQELREQLGHDRIERSSYAPRFTALVGHGWAEQVETIATETTMGGTASPYRITDAGRREFFKRAALVNEREAEHATAGGSFGPVDGRAA